MPKSEICKKRHAHQIVAAETEFERYKVFITNEFIEKFGGSYQNPKEMKDIWCKSFKYSPECEVFLIKKTKLFIGLLEDCIDKRSPVFFKNFIAKVCEYLAPYISKKGISHNECKHQLRETLLVKNRYVQSLLNGYSDEVQHADALRKIYEIRITCFREQTRYKHL